ncbi:MAG TPA: DUF2207 domain-containing protein, partial [Anaerolineaceae bacterium]|nr:DUF2207 domain-containing protein [Anaerolineaceae bacterium]
MLRTMILLLVAWLVWLPGQAAAAQSYAADRFDVLIEVQDDGTLLVTETVAFRFAGGPFTYAFRELELDQLDRVEIVSAGMDGADLPAGEGAGQVEIDTRGDPYEITWHFPPTSDRVRTFTLVYRVFGNIRIADEQDVVYWQAIPEEHEYDIAQANIAVRFPADLQPAAAPRLEGAAASEPQVGPGTVSWQVTGIPADQALSARVAFPAGSLIDRPPAWQAESLARGAELRAAVPFAVGIIALAAAFTAWWALTQRRREA